MRQLGLSYPTLKKELNYLLKKKWITDLGERSIKTNGGEQVVKAYQVTNLWDINSNFYKMKRDAKMLTPLPKGGKQGVQK